MCYGNTKCFAWSLLAVLCVQQERHACVGYSIYRLLRKPTKHRFGTGFGRGDDGMLFSYISIGPHMHMFACTSDTSSSSGSETDVAMGGHGSLGAESAPEPPSTALGLAAAVDWGRGRGRRACSPASAAARNAGQKGGG